MLSPGSAYLIAYLQAPRSAWEARSDVLMHISTSAQEDALIRAVAFAKKGLEVEASMLTEAGARRARLIAEAGPALGGDGRPARPTPLIEAAWSAGEAARAVSIAVSLAAQIAYLRCAAPTHEDLREQAAACARALPAAATKLQQELTRTGLPLVISHAGNVARMISLTRDLAPTTTSGYGQMNELVRDLTSFLEAAARRLDQAPPAAPISPPSAREDLLLSRILDEPADYQARLEFAKLAAQRQDPRAELIFLQLTSTDANRQQRIHDLVRSHPHWTERLRAMGARDIQFAGGFPDELTVDAELLLSRGRELLSTAPLTKLHVRHARGRVGELVRSTLLTTIEALDLDDQGVTDDDVIALAASPYAARLRQLDLRFNPLTQRGIEALAGSLYLRRLEVVSLDGNPSDPVDRVEVLEAGRQ